jgi:hypothetical protein
VGKSWCEFPLWYSQQRFVDRAASGRSGVAVPPDFRGQAQNLRFRAADGQAQLYSAPRGPRCNSGQPPHPSQRSHPAEPCDSRMLRWCTHAMLRLLDAGLLWRGRDDCICGK